MQEKYQSTDFQAAYILWIPRITIMTRLFIITEQITILYNEI